MKHKSEHFLLVEKKLGFPAQANDCFNALADRLDSEKVLGDKFDRIRNLYMFPRAHHLDAYLKKLSSIAEEYGENEYTMHFVFLMCCSELLLKRYRKNNISDEIYWDTVSDLRYKLKECMDCEEVAGTFVAGWYDGFFNLTRFGLGRFQYQYDVFDFDYTTKSGVKIKKGTKCVAFHIPSSGVPLTDEVRFDSYKRAYKFFKNRLCDGNLILVCDSWLLYKKHYKFLPKNSNILRFMDDFDIFKNHESDSFHNGWRVFGKYSDNPISELPEDTSLQRAYKTWLLNGNKAGGGSGVIVFDGEKII